MDKLHIEKNTIQETLVIPLWGRKFATELYPSIYQDRRATELIDRLDYDFGRLEAKRDEMMFRFGYLEAAMRYTDLGIEVRDYLKEHPDAAVVNLGCGLDCTAENNAGEGCRIYNVDRPDVIAVRNQMLPPDERTKNIGADLNDTAWFERVDGSNGAVFFAAGVFYYFTTDEARALFQAMAKRFGGGRLVFDAAGARAVKVMLKTWVKAAGITDVSKYFSVEDPVTELGAWLPGATVSARGYMLGYNDLKDPSVSWFFRLLSEAADGPMKMRIVRIDF